MILYSYLQNCADDDLFCLRTGNVIYILSKGCLKLDFKFLQNYIISPGFKLNILEIIKLDKDSILYKEHYERIQNSEFLWKYIERYYYIGHSFISEDKNTKEIYINNSYIKEKNQVKSIYKIQHVPATTKRKYIRGITVGEYIKNKSIKEKILIIDKLLNYIFYPYKDEQNPEKVSGDLIDCHLYNFIIGEDSQFHFIDFDLKCTESIDRNYCIYFMLYNYDIDLYKKMLSKYGYNDRHKYYEKNFSIYRQPPIQNGKSIITQHHKRLQQKYFSDEGISQKYKIKYKKVKL